MIMQIYSCGGLAKGIILLLVMGTAVAGHGQDSPATTSPMELLRAVPKVKLNDAPPTPARQAPVPYYPPQGQAPYIAPVEPALTPYAGNTTGNARRTEPEAAPDYLNYGGPVATPAVRPRSPENPAPFAGPTPRPVLGPEDVEQRQPRKKGIVRGLLNVLPFVGDEEEAAPPPTPTPRGMVAPPPGMPPRDEEVYRGYYEPTPAAPTDSREPLLRPNAPPVGRRDLPPDPEPSSPGAEPPPVETEGVVTPDDPGAIEPSADAPVLTVKREQPDGTTEPATSATPAPAENEVESAILPSAATKTPSVSPPPILTPTPRAVATPRPTPENIIIAPAGAKSPSRADADETTLSVSVEEAPAPEVREVESPAVTTPEAVTPDAPAAAEATPAVPDEVTSLTIVQADLGMPNPVYEQNATILGEFQQAVKRARAEAYAEAAQLFREYVGNHPSSGLAPRAAYLSVVFEKSNAVARESLGKLKELFPDSHYVKDAEKRRPELAEAKSAAAASPTPVADETPRAKADRLEKELTAAIGDTTKEPQLRRELGETYLDLEEFDRAWEVLRPAVDLVSGQPAEGQILLMLARCQMARKDTVRALGIVENVEAKYPEAVSGSASASWIAGLVYESGGKYARARSLYGDIRLQWPDSKEAGWASARLNDLAAMGR